MRRHREVVAGTHRGRGLEVIALDWTYVHHERGPTIYAVKRAYDHAALTHNLPHRRHYA